MPREARRESLQLQQISAAEKDCSAVSHRRFHLQVGAAAGVVHELGRVRGDVACHPPHVRPRLVHPLLALQKNRAASDSNPGGPVRCYSDPHSTRGGGRTGLRSSLVGSECANQETQLATAAGAVQYSTDITIGLPPPAEHLSKPCRKRIQPAHRRRPGGTSAGWGCRNDEHVSKRPHEQRG